MAITFFCPACQAMLRLANEALAGKLIKCPKCSKPVRIPAAEKAEQPAVPPVEESAVIGIGALPPPAAPPKPVRKPQPAVPPEPAPTPVQKSSLEEEETLELKPPAKAPPPEQPAAGPLPMPVPFDEEEGEDKPKAAKEKTKRKKAGSVSFGVLDVVGLIVVAAYVVVVVLCFVGVFDTPLPPPGSAPVIPLGGNGGINPPGGQNVEMGQMETKDPAKETALAAQRQKNIQASAAKEAEIIQILEKRGLDTKYSGTALSQSIGHPQTMTCAAFSPDGEFLATGGYDKTVLVHELRTGKPKWHFKDHNEEVKDLAFSPDGKTLATASKDGNVRFWDLQTGLLKKTTPVNGSAERVFFTPDSKKLVICAMAKGTTKDFFTILDLSSNASEQKNPSGTPMLKTIVMSPDGKYLAWGGFDNKAHLWEPASGKLIRRVDLGKLSINSVAFSPDGWTLAIGASDFSKERVVKLVDLENGQEKTLEAEHPASIGSVVFSPDGKWLAVGYSDIGKGIKFFELASLKEKGKLIADCSSSFMKFSPGATIFSAAPGYQSGINLWSVAKLFDPKQIILQEAIAKLKPLGMISRKGDGIKIEIYSDPTPEKLAPLNEVDIPVHIERSFSATPTFLTSLAGAKKLTGLNVSNSNKLDDASLAALKDLGTLKELNLQGIKKITDAGLVHLASLKNLTALDLRETGVTGAGLVHLKGLANLAQLNLDNCKLKDADLAHLAGLTKMQQLRLSFTDISDAGLVHLQKLTDLKKLELQANQKIRDPGMVNLKGLTNLEDLDLWSTDVGDAGLANIAELTKLKRLKIDSTKVSDAGFVHLAKLTNLEDLDLNSLFNVKGSGLKILKDLPKVTHLNLRSTSIDDAGMENIKEVKQLRHLELPINLTDAGLVHVAALPELEILYAGDLQQLKGDGLKHLKANTKLKELNLGNSGVTDAGLTHLADMNHLQELALSSHITDAGLAHLSKLTKLKKLEVFSEKVTNMGVAHLKSLTGLEELNLTSTSINDSALMSIQDLPNLKKLYLPFNKVSEGAKTKLRMAKPGLQVF